MRTNSRPEWLTEGGFLDPLKLPLAPLITQAFDAEEKLFRSACVILGAMAARGGQEAGVVLLGLFLHYRDDAGRVPVVVSSLGMVHTKAAVNLLVEEFHRVPSTNTTRGYLNTVLGALTRLPRALWEPELLEMARDARFSPKWRAKFEDALSSE